jgi:hypothetical protein
MMVRLSASNTNEMVRTCPSFISAADLIVPYAHLTLHYYFLSIIDATQQGFDSGIDYAHDADG